jgi:hypothetical protein
MRKTEEAGVGNRLVSYYREITRQVPEIGELAVAPSLFARRHTMHNNISDHALRNQMKSSALRLLRVGTLRHIGCFGVGALEVPPVPLPKKAQ